MRSMTDEVLVLAGLSSTLQALKATIRPSSVGSADSFSQGEKQSKGFFYLASTEVLYLALF